MARGGAAAAKRSCRVVASSDARPQTLPIEPSEQLRGPQPLAPGREEAYPPPLVLQPPPRPPAPPVPLLEGAGGSQKGALDRAGLTVRSLRRVWRERAEIRKVPEPGSLG